MVIKHSKIIWKKVGVSQKAFVFRKDGKFLTMRRTKTAPSNPLKWDLPGGDIEFGEVPLSSMLREIKEETSLIVDTLHPFSVESTIYRDEYWITVAYTAFARNENPVISWEHDLYKWVTLDEFLKLTVSKKLRKFAKTLKSSRK